MSAAGSAANPRWWVPGDWNGFFGLFTNVVLNVIVLTGLCLGVVNLPADTVFGRILPALGIALPIGNLYYAYLAYKLAKLEGRTDVTAMPYGPSVPHMFIVVFVIMLPVYLKTKDPMLAWQAGLAWAFIIGVIVLAGVFFGPWIRAHTPRAAMLGTLAGISSPSSRCGRRSRCGRCRGSAWPASPSCLLPGPQMCACRGDCPAAWLP